MWLFGAVIPRYNYELRMTGCVYIAIIFSYNWRNRYRFLRISIYFNSEEYTSSRSRLDQLCSSDWILFLPRSLKLVSNSPLYWLTNSTFCYLWEFLRNQTSRVSNRDSRSLLNCRISAWKSWRSEKYSSRWHDRQMQMFNSAETGEGGKNCFRVFSNSLNPPGL